MSHNLRGMKSWRRRSVCALLILGLLAPGAAADEAGRGHALSLLFIGNSLTYTNDLPAMLGRMLEGQGFNVERIVTKARPNFGLQDHWSSKTTRRAIAEGGWDYVIMQQGPSATEGRPSLMEYSRLLEGEIRSAGARPALYMVWPSAARLSDFPGVAHSYRSAAEAVDGLLLPVGEAWMAAWTQDPKLKLYGHDGFHPSRLGTYLACLVMYQQITGRDPRTLPPAIPGLKCDDPLDPEIARVLQKAAVKANAAHASDG